MNFAWQGIFDGSRVMRAMIGITVSAAYAALAPTLRAGSTIAGELAPDREYRVWLPRDVVNQVRALRQPGESYSDVILRWVELR